MAGKGVGMQDIEYWTLEQVQKFNALLDMESDHTAAWKAFHMPKPKGE